ncbi:DUF4833 domain-containing protein [Sandaracinus amylolyticus]|uniref:DUF4833 domain-containing protein n=1 Tax=Sandaracinus amylolyticus TaxID=927083 RepID=A0A0F6YG56_9BACT|nr:DUF4833 domain-containing protein [Sandaracinus amylolyticus]AKF04345.1 hypothetical protein DB32_001494 [Sandaracinus amylolyticus]
MTAPRASLLVALALLVIVSMARADPRIGAFDLPTLFYIAKSDDRNRVDYGVRLDEQCSPASRAPIYAYWRRFEPGQEPLADLSMLDHRGYGIAHQSVRVSEPNGSWIELRLQAFPQRRLLALVQLAGDRCVGAVHADIDGREAVLDHVFVHLDGPMQVREIELRGEERATGRPLVERLRP